MTNTRKPVPARTKALLQKEINSLCPLPGCGNDEVDHFQIHHIDENPKNNDFDNLLLLCPICHSKITKGDIIRTEVILLKKQLKRLGKEKKILMGKVINFHSKVDNAIVGDNNAITINQKKSATNKYPDDCIGADTIKANYISYLITRYHQYKAFETGKDRMNYAIFPSSLKKKFKIGKNRSTYNIHINRFDELALYIQSRIDSTKLAKVNKSKGQLKNYQIFDEYRDNQT